MPMTTYTTTTASPTGHPAYSQTLRRTPSCVAGARGLVRAALGAWGLGELADDGALVVSELVGNAVRHARCREIGVTVTRTGRDTVRIAVVDGCHAQPVRRPAGDEAVCGRGLLVVEALTVRWGTDRLAYGKRVWAELRGTDTG